MTSKSSHTLVIVIICILAFPILIGIISTIFGIIAGIISAVFGGFAWLFGSFFQICTYPFFGCNTFSAIAIVLIVLLIVRSKRLP
jgi:hypothetical protein